MIRWNDIWQVMRREFRSIVGNRSALMLLAGGIFLYGLMYNYMYSPNVLRDVPVAVVDASATPLSRRYARLLDATPQAKVAGDNPDLPTASALMNRGEVAGIVFLPEDFDAKVGRGDQAVFVNCATTSAFLYYAALQGAMSGAMLALDEEVRPHQVVFLPSDAVQPVVQTPGIGVVGTALYNATDGYASYLIPAVLMVILFQTMLMLISMRCGEEYAWRREERLSWSRAASTVLGKAAVYAGFYALFSVFLVGLLPLVFGLPHLASPLRLAAFLSLYLFATAFFGLACSVFFKDSDAPLLLIAFFSVGLLFLSGVSWPLELMPPFWRLVHLLIPAPVGILAFVKLNSMDATLADASREMGLLAVQCVMYFALACRAYHRK